MMKDQQTVKEDKRYAASDKIPPITNPMGRYWDQPDRSRIELSSNYAYMDNKTFHILAEYHYSNPTGVYEGKMWRRHIHYKEGEKSFDYWLLMWYGPHPDPGKVSVNKRTIKIESLLKTQQ
jgi:hypothetical protein